MRVVQIVRRRESGGRGRDEVEVAAKRTSVPSRLVALASSRPNRTAQSARDAIRNGSPVSSPTQLLFSPIHNTLNRCF